MATQSTIGAAILSARKKQKLTRQQVEKLSGVHHSTLFHLEKGQGNTSLGNLLAVCDVLGLELALLDKQVSSMTGSQDRTELTQSQRDSMALMGRGPGTPPALAKN